MKLGHVALDGAKVNANASKSKAMSYKPMKENEAQLAAEVGELPRRAQAVDVEMGSAHEVIVAARAANLTSDKQQAAQAHTQSPVPQEADAQEVADQAGQAAISAADGDG